ncbi:MAG: hypothetical protein KAR65_09085 [Anaerolineales bacterium]|nr:hypothetical protein [Anaerolineales bacterium]
MEQTDHPQPQSRKILIIGILHLVFAAIYIYLAFNALLKMEDLLSQVPSSYRGSMRTANFLDIAIDGIGFVGLLIAGIMLLQKRAMGRTITRKLAPILVGGIVVIMAYTLIAFGDEVGSSIIVLGLGLLVRFAYPLIAARQLAPSDEELGLT